MTKATNAKTPDPHPVGFLTVAETCVALGVSAPTLDRLRAKGELVCRRWLGRVLFTEKDVLELRKRRNGV